VRFSRDGWLALGLFLVLVLVTVASAARGSSAPTIPYLSTSSQRDGTRALALWLSALGYRTLAEAGVTYKPPADADVILILQPILQISEGEWKQLDRWVEGGGTLVLAGDGLAALLGFDHYDFQLDLLTKPSDELRPQTPLMTSPAITLPAPLHSDVHLSSERSDFITHLAADGLPLLVSFDQGRGRVILAATAYPFSNQGLKDEANATLVLNIVALSARKLDAVWLDDWHHGVHASGIIGPEQWLRSTSFGHALLFLAGAIFVTLLLQGRAFGRPVPLPHEIRRRGPLEHVTAIANLNRKAGHRTALLQQYHSRLKRHLGRRYRLDPSLPDAEYVEQLVQYNPALDKSGLLDLLQRLSQDKAAESEMVKLTAEASAWIDER